MSRVSAFQGGSMFDSCLEQYLAIFLLIINKIKLIKVQVSFVAWFAQAPKIFSFSDCVFDSMLEQIFFKLKSVNWLID